MHGPDQRGGEHQQVAEAGRVEAVARHEQADGQQAHTGGCVEGEREAAAVARAVEEGSDHDGQADDQPRVRGTRVGDTVCLHHQDGRLGDPQRHADPELVAGPSAGLPVGGDQTETGERGQGVPREQHDQDGQYGGGGLGGQIAGTPDEGYEEEYRIGTSGIGHALTLHRPRP